MPTLETGNSRKDRKGGYGFTLIELLIVIFILSLISSIIIVRISINPAASSRVESYSKQVYLAFLYLQEQAILQSQQIGVSFTDHRMVVKNYSVEFGENSGEWIEDPESQAFKNLTIPKNIQVSMSLPTQPNADQIIFYSSGDISPFELQISDKTKVFHITGYAYGDLKLEQ